MSLKLLLPSDRLRTFCSFLNLKRKNVPFWIKFAVVASDEGLKES